MRTTRGGGEQGKIEQPFFMRLFFVAPSPRAWRKTVNVVNERVAKLAGSELGGSKTRLLIIDCDVP